MIEIQGLFIGRLLIKNSYKYKDKAYIYYICFLLMLDSSKKKE